MEPDLCWRVSSIATCSLYVSFQSATAAILVRCQHWVSSAFSCSMYIISSVFFQRAAGSSVSFIFPLIAFKFSIIFPVQTCPDRAFLPFGSCCSTDQCLVIALFIGWGVCWIMPLLKLWKGSDMFLLTQVGSMAPLPWALFTSNCWWSLWEDTISLSIPLKALAHWWKAVCNSVHWIYWYTMKDQSWFPQLWTLWQSYQGTLPISSLFGPSSLGGLHVLPGHFHLVSSW